MPINPFAIYHPNCTPPLSPPPLTHAQAPYESENRWICCGKAPENPPPPAGTKEWDLRNVLRGATAPDLRLLKLGTRSDEDGLSGLARVRISLAKESGDEQLSVGPLWRQHILDALMPHGGIEEDTGKELPPTRFDVLLHVCSFPWKVIAAVCCPPTSWLGGGPSFVATLAVIGAFTALISDLASILGCLLNIPDPITAITLVAVGTSIPDTFASKLAAQNEPTADAALTNVTGSNAVNVFLGLGLPWLFASLYWKATGPTDEWRARYPEVSARYPGGAYVLIGGDLGFSVSLFFTCSIIGIGVLLFRRYVLGAELGGPNRSKYASSAVFFALWLAYIVTVICRFATII
ncbi:Sodium/calcium exchanger protein-domain-containing protein [Pavlovales sp. CCMP2436]|nr:Sodium/calcium exchanger protein-domain-containing protein [Pavlovales sp. CCMP2436]